MSELRYLASRTFFSDSPLARIIAGLIKVIHFGCSFLSTGDMISYCSRMLSNLLTFFYVSELVLCLLFVFENCVRLHGKM